MIKSRARAAAKAAPMAHQRLSLVHDKANPVVFDVSDPGTGKTPVRVWAFAERRRKRGGCLLVLAPRSLLESAWASDFAKFAPDMKVSVATAANREAAFAVDADVYVTNHDAVKWVASQKRPFFAKFSELCVDESGAYKHASAQRSRAASKIAKFFERRSCLNGTPNGNSICDVWHQVYLLDDGKRLGPNFYGFRNSVSVPEQVGRKREAVRWVDKDGAEEAVFGLISDITVRHVFEECTDIPPNHFYTVDYKLTPKAQRAYDEMTERHLLPLATPTKAKARLLGQKPPELTAVNAAAVGTKLLQIGSGAVYDNDGKVHVVDNDRAKLVLELVEARKHSLVFFYWDHQREQFEAEAKARGITYCVLDGNTKDTERDSLIRQYQAGFYRTCFAHPQSAAHGLTLTRGTATIWPGPTANLEWFKQGSKRQYRIGQTQKTETIMIVANTFVEQRVYHDILMSKDKRMTTFLDLFAAMTNEMKEAA